MGFLNTFFNVGKYSDKEIAEAAGLYYGLGPIDSASVSASAAKAEANVTVNVNIGEQTATGGKQYVPERTHDGEYHVIYKNRDDTSPASKTSGGKKAEAKPESKTEANTEPQKPKADKTAEKAPAQPKPVEVTGQQALAKTSDLNKKLEDAKNAILKPDTSPASTSSKKSEAKPESPKQESKPEDQEPQKPKADKTAEKAPAQPKPVEVTGQQAAHTMNNGFDYTRFQAQAPVVAPAPQQQSTIPTPILPTPLFPANYRELTPEQKCDHLVTLINYGLLPWMRDPRPGMTVEQKAEELKKHIVFMDMPGRQIGEVRIGSLLNLLGSPSLKNAMSKNESVDRANNPKLTEVPVSKYATGQQAVKFDMAFEIKLKDPKKILVVLYSTVPSYDPVQNTWTGDLTIFVKEV